MKQFKRLPWLPSINAMPVTDPSLDKQKIAPSSKWQSLERLMAIAWSGTENFCRQILSLVFFFVSVRFLHPADLGIFSLALAVNTIPMIFIDEMVGESLVQQANSTLVDWNTGFTINILISIAFLLVSLVVSGPIAGFLNEPALNYAIPILSLASFIGSLGNIQKAYLARALQFRSIAQAALIGQIVSGVFAVFLAIKGFGYWALIENVVGSALICSLVLWFSCSWKPRLALNVPSVRSRGSYAFYVALIRVIYLLRDQSPVFIAGLMFGVTEVGFFSLALRVARSLGLLFEEVAARPLLSMVSREQHDVRRFGNVLTEAIVMIGMAALPSYFGLAVLGPYLLPLAFGTSWSPAGIYLPWICIVLGNWLLLHVAAVALRARSLSRQAVLLTATLTLFDMILFLTLARFGLKTALIALALRSILSVPIAAYVFQRCLGISLRRLFVRCFAPLVATGLMVCLLLAFRDFGFTSTRQGLFLTVSAAGMVYIILATSMLFLGRRLFGKAEESHI